MFWEYYYQSDICEGTLQILTEDLDKGTVVSKTVVAVEKYSNYKTKYNLYESASSLFVHKVKHLQELGYQSLFENYIKKNNSPINLYSYPLYKSPTFWNSLLTLYVLLKSWFVIKLNKYIFSKKTWTIGYYPSSSQNISLGKFKVLKPPKNTFCADPFIVEFNGQIMLFLESLYNDVKGKIEMMIFRNNTFKDPVLVLEEDFHLSYPFL